MKNDELPKEPSSSARVLLGQLLDNAIDANGSISAMKFRANNYSMVAILDEMESRRLIRNWDNRYVVTAAALPLIDTDAARQLMSDIERLYELLREHYHERQEEPILVSQLAANAKISVDAVLVPLQLMLDSSIWWRGHSTNLAELDAYVIPGEAVLKYSTFKAVVEEINSWSKSTMLSNLADASPLSALRSKEPEKSDGEMPLFDIERELPLEQVRAVLAVVDDVVGMKFNLGSYYDDVESRGLIDEVLSGKIDALRYYCDVIGWRRMAKQLFELTPVRGAAVSTMELLKSFVAPEVRRLAGIKELKEKQPASSILSAWPAIRACLQEFNFYEIKEVTGLSGLDVTSIAHLVQKSSGGASKGQLISAIDEVFGKMPPSGRTRFLTILAEEILRRMPDSEGKLSEYLSRLGWTFFSQTLLPLHLLDPQDLFDAPEESHKDLIKAAGRFRDGDLSGAISGACGAVDSATASVYRQMNLGDPTQASFQERCKKATLAKGVLLQLDQQLQLLGWEQCDIVPFRKNLEGALNQGAYVMQTLRSHMGDVHGSKPILRPLVLDCLRWAELIVGSLVTHSKG